MPTSLPTAVSTALLALSLSSQHFAAARLDTTWKPEGNRRPSNITDLDYDLYRNIGSYYNGSLHFHFDVIDSEAENAIPDRTLYTGDACHEYVNRRLNLTYKAVVGLNKVASDYEGSNPFQLIIHAVDPQFEVMGRSGEDDKTPFSGHQKFRLDSGSMFSTLREYEERWLLSVDESSSDEYKIDGQMTYWGTAWGPSFRLNLSDTCDHSRISSDNPEPDNFIFQGPWLGPINETESKEESWDAWMKGGRWAALSSSFGPEKASLEINALFRLMAPLSQFRSDLRGNVTISFEGDLDRSKSDEMVMNKDNPEWNPTMGFQGGDGGSSGSSGGGGGGGGGDGDDNAAWRGSAINGWLLLGGAIGAFFMAM